MVESIQSIQAKKVHKTLDRKSISDNFAVSSKADVISNSIVNNCMKFEKFNSLPKAMQRNLVRQVNSCVFNVF